MFADKISKILQLQGIRPYHVAKETGISQGTMAEYVSGKKKPGLDNLVKIADFLDVSLDDLCDRNQEEDGERQSKTLHFHVISKKGNPVIIKSAPDDVRGDIIQKVRLLSDEQARTLNAFLDAMLISQQQKAGAEP